MARAHFAGALRAFAAVQLQRIEPGGGDGLGDGGIIGIDEQADAGDPALRARGERGGVGKAQVARGRGVEDEAGIGGVRRDRRVERLPLIYLITGFCTIFTGPMIGRGADRFGKFPTFVFGTVLAIVMVTVYTHLGPTPLFGVVAVNAVLFVGIFSRMIPAQALMSAIPAPAERGAFMSVSSSLQQISGGIASALAGLIVVQEPSGHLLHFEKLGYVVCVASLLCLLMMNRLRRLVPDAPAAVQVVAAAGH